MSTLSPTVEKYVLHWGEMGTRWGINRTVAQIHALLFLSPEPLHAEQICQTLGVARSNVSNSLKELMGWGIVKTTQVLGDRRDYFLSLTDPWEMFHIILEERKRREIDPTITVVRDCVKMAQQEGGVVLERLTEMQNFLETSSSWYNQLMALPKKALIRFMKLGAKIQS